jgi:hypothetical protein
LSGYVTLDLGAALAKSLLKVWLRDIHLAPSISTTLVDILRAKTSDAVSRNKIARQLEELGERIATRLLPIFEETNQLEEGSRIAVTLSAANTINSAHIEPGLLARQDLDPSLLANFLLSLHQPQLGLFSSDEVALYRRILIESSRYIIDISSQLPNFTDKTLSELLRRDNQLFYIANNIFEEVRRVREISVRENTELAAVQFETDYRLSVIRNLDELQLYGVDLPTSSRRHRLSVAYVTLSVERRGLPADYPGPHSAVVDEVEKENRDIVSADDALATSRRLLVRGLAGSGKTTLLQWVAVRSASRSFDGPLDDLNTTVPFFIRLRHCVESGLPAPENFAKQIAPAIAGLMPPAWVHRQLQSGRAVVLIDGIDEVPRVHREAVKVWLHDLVQTYPESRYLVTSRPQAAVEGWLADLDFDDAELQPMSPQDIDSFIQHWHEAVIEQVPEEEANDIRPLPQLLQQHIRSSRTLRNLATSPLLCAMLCALHRARRKRLPADRIELYEACCQLLLERRDIERGIDLRDYPELSYRAKTLLLEDLAYWLLKNGWSDISTGHVDSRLDMTLKRIESTSSRMDGGKLREFFVERTGMLRMPIPDRIDFTHRTFQEYFAAQSILNEGDIGVLIGHANDDQWREVIILAAGRARPPERAQIILELLSRGDSDSNVRHQLHLLAVACLETSVELDPSIKSQLESRLSALVPPKNITEAKDLASAGELALPYLRNGTKYRSTVAAACLRTLAMVGGDTSLEILEQYASDGRQAVVSELLRAWDYYDKTEYAYRIIPKMFGSRESIEIREISSLQGFESLDTVRNLSLYYCPKLEDLSPISKMKSLERLYLGYIPALRDLDFLSGLSNLRHLTITRCERLTNIDALKRLPNLSKLHLRGTRAISNIMSIGELKELVNL